MGRPLFLKAQAQRARIPAGGGLRSTATLVFEDRKNCEFSVNIGIDVHRGLPLNAASRLAS